VPTKAGSSSSIKPQIISVYLYWVSLEREGTSASTTTIAAMDRKSHITWRLAAAGASRITKVMPMLESM